MSNSTTTVTVGIPAYNEEQNIARLLRAVLKQKHDTFRLEKIIVVSDGSTDRTVDRVRSVGSRKIKLIVLKQNEGVGPAQNRIFDEATSDIVVLLDADVLPVGTGFLEAILAPFAEDKRIGLVSADRVAARPYGLMESFAAYGNELRHRIFYRINQGDNIYLCNGTARTFSKRLYGKLRWPAIASEDAYSYLKCREFGFHFRFVPEAKVLFRAPLTFSDHAKQSNRFRMSSQALDEFFPDTDVRRSYAIPIRAAVPVVLASLATHPLLTLGYISTTVCARIYKQFMAPVSLSEYEIATSSKQVVI